MLVSAGLESPEEIIQSPAWRAHVLPVARAGAARGRAAALGLHLAFTPPGFCSVSLPFCVIHPDPWPETCWAGEWPLVCTGAGQIWASAAHTDDLPPSLLKPTRRLPSSAVRRPGPWVCFVSEEVLPWAPAASSVLGSSPPSGASSPSSC